MNTLWIVAFVSIAFLALLNTLALIGIFRRVVGVLERAESLATGTPNVLNDLARRRVGATVEDFLAVDDAGEPVDAPGLLNTDAVFIFISSHCSPCRSLASQLVDIHFDDIPLYAIVGDADDAREILLPPAINVLHQVGRSASEAFQNMGTPHGFAVSDRLIVESMITNSAGDVAELVQALRKEVASSYSRDDVSVLPEQVASSI